MYLDSAIVLKLLVPEPDSVRWAALVDGQEVTTSALALTEVFSALQRKEREGVIRPAFRRRAFATLIEDVRERRLTVLPLTEAVLAEARIVLEACHPRVALRTLDAIHLATARRAQSWPLCSNDVRVRQAASQLALPLAPMP
jgi:predicted nucleic acid-binding protein